MTADRPAPPTPRVDDALLVALRDDLTRQDYSVDGVAGLLGPLASAALHREQAVPALQETAGRPEPLATLIRTFLLGVPVTRRELDAALPVLGAAGAERLRLVAAAGNAHDDEVRAGVDLRPYAATDAGGDVTWWLSSDLGELVTGRALRADHVLGAGGASLTLAQITVRNERRRVWDLGTGCGIQALHASRHSERVVATDIAPRALDFARFNLALAQVDTVELRAGSMLEPVDGEHFDLVVSNPPFVITPRTDTALPDYDYRDGGLAGDDIVRNLIANVGSVLEPGGIAQFLGNWEHRRGQDWTERVGRWLDDSGLDGWVVQREVLDPAEYAETWLRDGGLTPERAPHHWTAAYRTWLEDFAGRGVDGIGMGLILLRRPESGGGGTPRWRRIEERTDPLHLPLGPTMAAALAARDWLASRDDAALLASRLVTAPDVSEERHYVPGAADPSVVILRQGSGFGRSVHASSRLAALVGASDGELQVGQILAAIGTLTDASTAQVTAELLQSVRGLIQDGLLLPS